VKLTVITQLRKYVDAASNIGHAAVPITISEAVVAKVVGFPLLGIAVIGPRQVLS
jgi:hypothetical protein